MSRALIFIAALEILLSAGCAHHARPSTPAPAYLINLPDHARLCVPRETFRNEGLACITVGELRAFLRSRRSA